jgi:hypothetical protein
VKKIQKKGEKKWQKSRKQNKVAPRGLFSGVQAEIAKRANFQEDDVVTLRGLLKCRFWELGSVRGCSKPEAVPKV